MAGTVAADTVAFAAEQEARLAQAAAAGDGSAFAALFERYGWRAYNLAYRVTGSEADAAAVTQQAFLKATRQLPKLGDGERVFGSYLFAATHHACHELMEKHRPTQPSDAKPEVRAANARLPERQREALALRELGELSYERIAAIMEMKRNSVAQLISRARINLRDELSGTALASVAAPSPECERALPLIAAREDGQLGAGSDDDAWLDAHLADCERCRLGVEAMREAGASYRAWAPIAVPPWLLDERVAKAGALAGVDWRGASAVELSARADPRLPPAVSSADRPSRGAEGWTPQRRRAIAAAGLAALLLGVVAAVLAGGQPSPTPRQPVGDGDRAAGPSAPKPGARPQKAKRRSGGAKASRSEAAAQATAAAPLPAPAEAGGGEPSAASPDLPQGQSGLRPPEAIAAPKRKPGAGASPQPAPAAAPPAASQPPAAPSTEEPGKQPPKGQPGEVPVRVGHG